MMKLLSPPRMQKMVTMRVIVIETYQKDINLIDKMLMLTNMIVMNMSMENHHPVKGSNESLVKN